ncbi:hypothetical protein D3C73_914730 [compost metagenome]
MRYETYLSCQETPYQASVHTGPKVENGHNPIRLLARIPAQDGYSSQLNPVVLYGYGLRYGRHQVQAEWNQLVLELCAYKLHRFVPPAS